MLPTDKYQELLAFAHETAETIGCGSLVHEHRIEENSESSTIAVEFSTRGMKIGRVFSDTELTYCRLPVREYITVALNDLPAFKIQCESNRRGPASAVE